MFKGSFPQLDLFLASPRYKKVIASKLDSNASDFKKLSSSFGYPSTLCKTGGYLSLQDLAASKKLPIGLEKLSEHFKLVCLKMKPKLYQRWADNWAVNSSLRDQMLQYAADDAILCLKLYRLVLSLPKNHAQKGGLARIPCPIMLKTNSCSKENCEFSHQLLPCTICNIICTSSKSFQFHVKGKKHKLAEQNLGKPVVSSTFFCPDCEMNFISSEALTFHNSSKKHRNCKKTKQFRQTKDLMRQDKGGFNFIGPDPLDFGVLTKGEVKKITFTIENVSTAGQFLSVNGNLKTSDPVELKLGGLAEKTSIPKGGNVSCYIIATALKTGYFQCELGFNLFRDGQTFVISRTVIASVGEKGLYDLLKPQGKWSGKRVNPSISDAGYVTAGQIPELQSAQKPYVNTLDFYDIPKGIKTVMSIPRGELIMPKHLRFSKDFFATDFVESGSYRKFFSALLWSEETQLELDIREYSLFGVELNARKARNGLNYMLAVPGLAEARPSVLKGDSVLVRLSGRKEKAYEARAIVIELNHIILKFCSPFDEKYLNGLTLCRSDC